jgi:hypothetical protein
MAAIQHHNAFDFDDATRENILIKMALTGPPGGGKTRSALGIATYLAEYLDLGEVYLIDSENRSSAKYAFDPRTGKGFKFKSLHLPTNDYSPQCYMRAIEVAEKRGARILIIDSLSHAWNGVKGILEQVNDLTDASRSKNAFSEGWRKATPLQRQFIQAMLGSPAHIIATMRSDPEWVVQEDERGKKSPTMIGLSPQQRKDISFEFDLCIDLKIDHTGVVSKSRCEELNENNGVYKLPGENVARILAEWVRSSDAPLPAAPTPVVAVPRTPVASDDNAIHAALAADIKRRLDAAESDESIDATAGEIRNLPETLRPALRVTADKMRVALARTTVRLDEIQSSEGYARHADKGRRFLDGAVAAKREELTHHAQPPAPVE